MAKEGKEMYTLSLVFMKNLNGVNFTRHSFFYFVLLQFNNTVNKPEQS